MGPIGYVAPRALDDAMRLLSISGARALAGGTDLIVQLREHLREADLVVDVKRIPELTAIEIGGDGTLTLGAAVPCHRIYKDERIARAFPALVDAARIIGGIAIQGRASVGGNLCNAGPAADSIPALIAHAAVCLVAGPGGRREIPVASFCTAPGRTVLGPGELLVALRLPAVTGSASAYLRFIPREEMDIAVVGASAWIALERGVIRDARVGLAAVAPTPLLVEEATAALLGRRPDPESFAIAGEAARRASRPITDQRGTAEHRSHLAGVLTQRVLAMAAERARRAV